MYVHACVCVCVRARARACMHVRPPLRTVRSLKCGLHQGLTRTAICSNSDQRVTIVHLWDHSDRATPGATLPAPEAPCLNPVPEPSAGLPALAGEATEPAASLTPHHDTHGECSEQHQRSSNPSEAAPAARHAIPRLLGFPGAGMASSLSSHLAPLQSSGMTPSPRNPPTGT